MKSQAVLMAGYHLVVSDSPGHTAGRLFYRRKIPYFIFLGRFLVIGHDCLVFLDSSIIHSSGMPQLCWMQGEVVFFLCSWYRLHGSA